MMHFISDFFEKVAEINARYAKPKIRTTPFVTGCLLTLRIYLVLLLLLLLYRFVTTVVK